jgi:methionyl-tRNA formyltransferase
MTYIYFGSSIFSRIILENLCRQNMAPLLIVSQPDKPKGRGLKLKPMEVATFALEKNITLLRPASLNNNDIYEKIRSQNPDFIVVADYGRILPLAILSIAKIMSLAIHPSLLPHYRGAAPINRALINGEKQTGTTVFKMNEKLDSGEIILQEMLAIEEKDDALTLKHKLARQGAELLVRTFAMITRRDYALVLQDEKSVSFAPKLVKADGKIKWNLEAVKIYNLIKGVADWPTAYSYYKGKLIKIITADIIGQEVIFSPGTIVEIKKDGIYIACGKELLRIKTLRPEGKKEMDAYAFVLGHKVKVGDKFE